MKQHGWRQSLLFAGSTAIAIVVAAGCTAKKEPPPQPPASSQSTSERKPLQYVGVHDEKGCLSFTPDDEISVPLGDSIVWVPLGLKDTAVIELPSGAFAESTWKLPPRGDPKSSGPALTRGKFDYKSPPACAPKTNGPGVDIGDNVPTNP